MVWLFQQIQIVQNLQEKWLWKCFSDQPVSNISHDRSSHFWDMAEQNEITESRLPKIEKDRVPLLDDSHLAMRVNLDACIQCGLCVRACREVQVNDVIGMSGRGHDAYPTFDLADPMGDNMCRLWRMCPSLPYGCTYACFCFG